MSVVGVGPTHFATLVSTVHRHGLDLPSPPRPSLAWLARKWFGLTIQDCGPGGHDPEEDARA